MAKRAKASPKPIAKKRVVPNKLVKAKKMPTSAAKKNSASTAKTVSVTPKTLAEGSMAPDFELPDQSGRTVSLGDLLTRGTTVLYFYPKDMTPGCTTEACSFRDSIDDMRAAGAEVVGISADDAGSHQKFIAKHNLNFPLLSDVENRVTRAYGVYKKKSLYGREFMGIERTTFIIGRDGTVRKVFPKVKVNGHSDDVIKALKEIAG